MTPITSSDRTNAWRLLTSIAAVGLTVWAFNIRPPGASTRDWISTRATVRSVALICQLAPRDPDIFMQTAETRPFDCKDAAARLAAAGPDMVMRADLRLTLALQGSDIEAKLTIPATGDPPAVGQTMTVYQNPYNPGQVTDGATVSHEMNRMAQLMGLGSVVAIVGLLGSVVPWMYRRLRKPRAPRPAVTLPGEPVVVPAPAPVTGRTQFAGSYPRSPEERVTAKHRNV